MKPTRQTTEILELLAQVVPEIGPGTPVEEYRAATRMGPLGDIAEMALVRDLTLPGPAGDIGVRHYLPSPDTVAPGVVFFHGGGFVIGDLDTHDAVCRSIAKDTGAAVVAVDYRLAPEHPFPAAVEDAFAATRWVAANAGELGIDPDRLAVAGDSAGGCLAAVVAMMARDAGGPSLSFQALVYPAVDWVGDLDGDTVAQRYPSRAQNGEGYFLTTAKMGWFTEHYLANADGPAAAADPRVSPLRAASHADLPPAAVITADFDPLRDEGEAYARVLAAAGVPTTTVRINDGFHGMLTLSGFYEPGKRAKRALSFVLNEAFTGGG